jgi:regulator of replication initiation timing
MELFSENRIVELEERIDALIKNYRNTKEEHQKLVEHVKSLEEENKELKERVSNAKNEREVIAGKVIKILEKIESVEV